ncbi:ribokinase [Acuticoccus yangtzensis]|uniref:ribokinase n=1 Tax=Acuticoccus yangtzensis TaxID=1443441 RepID=UPI000949508E|nr:ribokinase [Acuticoccus yangtzensis]
MTLWCLGSVNLDRFYRVPHILAPGETLAAHGLVTGIGGKGANMSVAAARAGERVALIGAVGEDGVWARESLAQWGVDTRYLEVAEGPTGHAIIAVADDGENTIIIHPGANHRIGLAAVEAALAEAVPGEWCLIQNETNLQVETAERARAAGLKIAYAAAPFTAEAAVRMAPLADLLILNRVEMEQLQAATGRGPAAQGVPAVVVTAGADGAFLHAASPSGGGASGEGVPPRHVPAVPVAAVDTTGAGDTFTGYLLAGLGAGIEGRRLGMVEAMGLAARAGAVMVTRHGTADVIPRLDEVRAI